MMKVITFNQIIGFHCWPDAPEKYSYLSDLHRHVFFIRCKFDVLHTDREIEINDMQERIEKAIRERFNYSEGHIVYFGGMSCEDIAFWCIKEFGCTECEVLEDGFGGAYVRL